MAESLKSEEAAAAVEFDIAKTAVYEFTKSFLLSGKEEFFKLDGSSRKMKYVDAFGNLIGGAIGLVAPGAGKSAANGIKKPFDYKDKRMQKTRKETLMSILNWESKYFDDNFQQLFIETGVAIFLAYKNSLQKIQCKVGNGDNDLENRRRAVQKLGKYAGSIFLEHIIESGSTESGKLLDTLRTPSKMSSISSLYQKAKGKVIKPKFYFLSAASKSNSNETAELSGELEKKHVTANDIFLNNNIPEFLDDYEGVGEVQFSEQFWYLSSIEGSAVVALTSAAISTDRKFFHVVTLLAAFQDTNADVKEIKNKLDFLANRKIADPILTGFLVDETDVTWDLKENSLKIKLVSDGLEGYKDTTGSLEDIVRRISTLNDKEKNMDALKKELELINAKITGLKNKYSKWDTFQTQNMFKANNDALEKYFKEIKKLRSSLTQFLRFNFSDTYSTKEDILEELHQNIELCSIKNVTDTESLECMTKENKNMCDELTKIRGELPEIKEALLTLQKNQLYSEITTLSSFERSLATAEKTALKEQQGLKQLSKLVDDGLATEPIPILKFDCKTLNDNISTTSPRIQTPKYKLLTENFISVLNKVGDHPIVVYCMSGNARLGKSYTLNFFVRRLLNQEVVSSSQLFKWRRGVERETVGINLWPEPFFMNDQNGRKIGILLMDAQGLFDEHTTLQQNSVIFALSSLFSTVCIFNLSKQIQSDTLQNVNFFTGYARAIGHKRENQGKLDDDSEKFQRLVIMVRDFENDDEFGFGYHDNTTAPLNTEGERRNYFHRKFPTAAMSNENSIPIENLAVIDGIRENFDNVGVILHPDPGSKFKKNPTQEKPTKEFIEKSQEFVELMLSPEFLVTKKIGGTEMSGREFIPFVKHLGVLCEQAVDIFPPAQTITESATIMSLTLARTTGYTEFTKEITASLKKGGLSDAELTEAYKKAKKIAVEAFHKIKKLGTDEQKIDTMNVLHAKCKAKFEALKKEYVLARTLAKVKIESRIQSTEIARLEKKSAADAVKVRKLEMASAGNQNVEEEGLAEAAVKISAALMLLYGMKKLEQAYPTKKNPNKCENWQTNDE